MSFLYIPRKCIRKTINAKLNFNGKVVMGIVMQTFGQLEDNDIRSVGKYCLGESNQRKERLLHF